MEVIPEIRRLHFVENVTMSDLAKQFKLSRPTNCKHLKTGEEPVYPTLQHQPHLKLGTFIEQLTAMDAVILDELGYLPIPASGGALLFHLHPQCQQSPDLTRKRFEKIHVLNA